MLKIGVTGGIGSGKTTVCKIFEVLGIPVFYADAVARDIMNLDKGLIQDIKTVFGPQAYDGNGLIDRKYLASIVFTDEKKLNELNAIVHPAVFRSFENWVIKQVQVPYVLKEAALLFESGSAKLCDKSILVTAPQKIKIERVMCRDNIDSNAVISRMERQFTDEKKSGLADYILKNDEHALMIPQVLKLHEHFLSLAK